MKFEYTPIIKSKLDINNNTIYIKREDLLPFCFGGNKVRIAYEYFKDMKKNNADCMIGYGNPRSNLCRILANMSYSYGIDCHIISSIDNEEKNITTNNNQLVKSCNVNFHMCNKSNVSDVVEKVLNECKNKNLTPYYIYGDKFGKGKEEVPIRAYFKVYQEIKNQEIKTGIKFDYIFLATGTGMTQSGLLSGKLFFDNDDTKIIGISVARKSEQEKVVVKKYIDAFCHDMKIKNTIEDICVIDDYVCGGYGKYNSEIVTQIKKVYKFDGLPLDSTYTGKAYYGMKEYIEKNNINRKNILFLHTGGVPLFFDNIQKFFC